MKGDGDVSSALQFDVVATGLRFPEGPIAMSDGSVLVVEIRRGTLSRVMPNGAIEVVAELGGGPNGAAIGPDGAVYVCNNGGMMWHDVHGITIPGHIPPDYRGGLIQRVDLDSGKVTTVYTECDGRGLRGPNDIVFDRHGGFWFSDLGKSDEWTADRGMLYYALADGSRIVRARTGMISPNGVGLSPDQKVLYVAETYTGRLWAMDIVEPGVLAPPTVPWESGRLIATLPGYILLDSLKVEQSGAICVAGGGAVSGMVVFGTDGSHTIHPIPGEVVITNICFGSPDLRDAWITASGTGRLYKTRWPRPGLALNYTRTGH
jgi:gluconolactonase